MIQSLHDKTDYDVKMIYSVKEPGEIIGKQLYDYMAGQGKFKLIEYIASQQGGKFLDVDYIKQNVPELKEREVFICGPPAMMKSLRSQLTKAGLKNSNIHTEEFSLQ